MAAYKIIEADIAKDLGTIEQILKRNREEGMELSVEWNYRHCPCGIPRSWLLVETSSGKFVGGASLFPRTILVDANPVPCAVAGDFSIDRTHRSFGPALILQKTVKESISTGEARFIYAIPNRPSESIFERAGYERLGEYRKYIHVLKTEFKSNRYLKPALLTRTFQGILNPLLGLTGKERSYHRDEQTVTEDAPSFDQRFDALWQKNHPGRGILTERTTAFLNWRYAGSTRQAYRVFSITRNNELAGYIVYYIQDNMCHISDIFCAQEDGVCQTLMAEFILFLKRRSIGSIYITYFGDTSITGTLRKFGFLNKKSDTRPIFIYTPDQTLAARLRDTQAWRFFAGDRDL